MPRFHAVLTAADRAEVRIAGTPFILTAVRSMGGEWTPVTVEHDGDVIEFDDSYDPEDFNHIGISRGALDAIERADREAERA